MMLLERVIAASPEEIRRLWDEHLIAANDGLPRHCTVGFRDGLVLYACAMFVGEQSGLRGAVLELGGGYGGQARVILKGLQAARCDAPFTTTEIDGGRLPLLRSIVEPRGVVYEGRHEQRPMEEWHRPLRLLSVDADHSAGEAEWYLREMVPLVEVGGMLTIHDMCPRSYREYDVVMAYMGRHSDKWGTIVETRFLATSGDPRDLYPKGCRSVFQRISA